MTGNDQAMTELFGKKVYECMKEGKSIDDAVDKIFKELDEAYE